MSATTSEATAATRALLSTADQHRRRTDRWMTGLVWAAFVLAATPLVSLLWTAVSNGIGRLNGDFLLFSMRNVYGGMDAGGAYHAIIGTLLITLGTAVISVPIGLLAAIYLVEYGRGPLARAVTFFVDVMTGIPSIVAGLFSFAVFAIFFGAGIRMGVMGSVALSLLMTPVVVRSCEEMLRLVPNELREASYALGVPKWLTIVKVVLRTSVAGLTTGVLLAVARVIGETAPLMIAVGSTASINTNLFSGSMETLPVFIYDQYKMGPVPCPATVQDCITSINFDRAWTAALTLVIVVVILNLLGRLVTRLFAPKLR
ncbi:phosphate ABC transporter permease PstA [Xylanimonas protaetiae]|uniref:Phosphate transport system permease protein PstA n=1 Tax=Xylanimonas protaetiae TaxID=2509457 RepID=A0A4P6F201_9MICO|nr:phosphate ABC transporter permease PstA [Xylanimonas protaetiae]QAY69175.1 phosphate ABC transporter permease PstA [Xylanimonas protaetiae]